MLWVDYSRLVSEYHEQRKAEQIRYYLLLYSITGSKEYKRVIAQLSSGGKDGYDYVGEYSKAVEAVKSVKQA